VISAASESHALADFLAVAGSDVQAVLAMEASRPICHPGLRRL